MRTVCQHITLHCLITFHHANMRGSSSRICVPKTFCHPRVMSRSFAAPDTDHQHKFSLTYLSNLTVILFYTHKPVVSRSRQTLRRFTGEWRFLGYPFSHTFWRRSLDLALVFANPLPPLLASLLSRALPPSLSGDALLVALHPHITGLDTPLRTRVMRTRVRLEFFKILSFVFEQSTVQVSGWCQLERLMQHYLSSSTRRLQDCLTNSANDCRPAGSPGKSSRNHGSTWTHGVTLD